jgi:hypothetical protein
MFDSGHVREFQLNLETKTTKNREREREKKKETLYISGKGVHADFIDPQRTGLCIYTPEFFMFHLLFINHDEKIKSVHLRTLKSL